MNVATAAMIATKMQPVSIPLDTSIVAVSRVSMETDGFVQVEFVVLAPVAQKKGDSAIHRINHYPADNTKGFVTTYPLDRDLSCG